VLKHAVLALTLEALVAKPKPLVYIESHAGSGGYDLTSEESRKTGEFNQGIARLWPHRDAFPELAPYLDAVAEMNPDGVLTRYPGSPLIAAHILRDMDRLLLIERHPREVAALRKRFQHDRRAGIHRRDGVADLPTLLPPKPARGLVLIDPSFEQEGDEARIADCLRAAHARWPTGVFAVWYPRLGRARDRTNQLLRAIAPRFPEALRCELQVAPEDEIPGLRGSGMLLINPPWQLRERLDAVGPRLASVLSGPAGPGVRPTWVLRSLGDSGGPASKPTGPAEAVGRR
jgi:23S rRNA (adenine2030-N6)-methyltransferase